MSSKWIINNSTLIFLLAFLVTGVNAKERSFVVASLGAWKSDPLYVMGSMEKKIELNLKDMSYSSSYGFKGNEIVFYTKEGEEFSPLFTVQVADDIAKPFILFSSRDESVNHRVFDISPKAFPFGSLKVHNGTKTKIGLHLNENEKVIEGDGVEVYPIEKDSEEAEWLKIRQIDTNKPLLSLMVMRRKTKRVFMFAFEESQKDGETKVKFRTLADFFQEGAEEKEQKQP